MPDGISHRQHRQPEGQGNAQQANPDIREGGGEALGVGGSDDAVGGAVDATMCTSTCGIWSMRNTG